MFRGHCLCIEVWCWTQKNQRLCRFKPVSDQEAFHDAFLCGKLDFAIVPFFLWQVHLLKNKHALVVGKIGRVAPTDEKKLKLPHKNFFVCNNASITSQLRNARHPRCWFFKCIRLFRVVRPITTLVTLNYII